MVDDVNEEVERLFELVRDRYGSRLTQEELEAVREKVKRIVETAMTLRSVKLQNSDEPFSVFKPHKKEV
ncbi:MAG: hypothetical protein PVJ38_01455 [Candidatus Bathyarchaeota archaeon]|jgi:hypothetical protein